jgi:hypothetical protein
MFLPRLELIEDDSLRMNLPARPFFLSLLVDLLSSPDPLASVAEGESAASLLMEDRRLLMERRRGKLELLLLWVDGGREGEVLGLMTEGAVRTSGGAELRDLRRSLIKSLTMLKDERLALGSSSSSFSSD